MGTAPDGTVITDLLDLSGMCIDADSGFVLSRLKLEGGIKATQATIAAASVEFTVGFCRSCAGRVGRKVQQETPPTAGHAMHSMVRGLCGGCVGLWRVGLGCGVCVCVCLCGGGRGPTSIASRALATSGAGVPALTVCVRAGVPVRVSVLHGLRARVCRPATAVDKVRGRRGFCGKAAGCAWSCAWVAMCWGGRSTCLRARQGVCEWQAC